MRMYTLTFTSSKLFSDERNHGGVSRGSGRRYRGRFDLLSPAPSMRNNIVTYTEKPPSDLIWLSYSTESSSSSSQRHNDSVEIFVGLFSIHCYIMPIYVTNILPIHCFQDSAQNYHDTKHPDGANTLQTQQVLLQALLTSTWEICLWRNFFSLYYLQYITIKL